jgi:hypothetical protein
MTQLPLDDCLYALKATIRHLTHSSPRRCLQKRRIIRLPDIEGDKLDRKKRAACPIGAF